MYDKHPTIPVACAAEACRHGYGDILRELRRALAQDPAHTLIVDCYPGVRYDELRRHLIEPLAPARVIFSDELTWPQARIEQMIASNITPDRVFGTLSAAKLPEYFDPEKLAAARLQAALGEGLTVVYGVGAALVSERGVLVVADLSRWEIQLRYRGEGLSNWLADNAGEDPLRKFKRGYFWEWRIADRHKAALLPRMDYLLDTNLREDPRMVTGAAFSCAMAAVLRGPFRTVPYFDPGVWGGQWMKQRFGLDPDKPNFAWSFDGVPEENSLLLDFGGTVVQVPCQDLLLTHARALLGSKVYARFGADFPIRFDLLDTMGGQNLSLQVHPQTAFIHEMFGMAYTQDESYYILDAKAGAGVYLGTKTGTDPAALRAALEEAQAGGAPFPAEDYVNRFPAKKHDHFLIPAGTVHCSGADTMVLEISATPYIFTFKLWDWGRMGLDGRPRPTHVDYGCRSICWERDTAWVQENLVNQAEPIDAGEGWREERTGLHELEFIETRRHFFSVPVTHHTGGSVNVLNLVEGDEAVVTSPTGAFAPFTVHYAETFILPAAVEAYIIAPSGPSAGKTIGTVKAYVRA